MQGREKHDNSPQDDALPLQEPGPPPIDPHKPHKPRKRYKLIVAYDGTHFHGWQKQLPPTGVPLRTVQGVLEQHISRVLWQQVQLTGASRTDAGVHALGQVASFDAMEKIPIDRLAMAINSRLTEDIEVRHAEIAPSDWQVIGDVTNKQYRYRIYNAPQRPLDRRHYVWPCYDQPLDIDAMRDAARRIEGPHDFEGFAAAGHGRLSTVRTVFHCGLEVDEPEIHLVIRGNGFLYNMVRIIAGTLVEVGRGRFEPSRIDEILAMRDRRLAGPTLPASGLWLEWISYDDNDVSQHIKPNAQVKFLHQR